MAINSYYVENPSSWTEVFPNGAVSAFSDISLQSLDWGGSGYIYVSTTPNWDGNSITLSVGQSVSIEGLTAQDKLYVTDDGSNGVCGVFRIDR